MFMSAVVLEIPVSTIYSATSYYSLLVQYAIFFRVRLCVTAAPVYYAVLFRVRLQLSAYSDSCLHDMTGKRALKQSREATGPSQWLIRRLCADKRRFSSAPPFFMFVDHISSHIGLVQTERNPLMPNMNLGTIS